MPEPSVATRTARCRRGQSRRRSQTPSRRAGDGRPTGRTRPSRDRRRPTASDRKRSRRPSTSPRPAAERAPSRPPRPSPSETPGVLLDDHVAEAGRKVLRFHLARMLAKEAGTRDGSDAEDLHDMRVATRRQRAAWRVFGERVPGGRTKTYRRGLREIAARLGAVRDLDVLLDAADDYRDDLPTAEQRALEPLLTGWRAHRDDARRLLVRELDADAYRRWVDDYSEFVRHEGLAVVPVAPTEPHRVRDTAGSRILTAYEGVRAYEPVLRWADVETLHELRIAGKWLRYTLEFSREALPPEASMLIARVTALQDHLGLLNDANVTAGMARSFLVENAGGLSSLESAAIGRYLVSREREVARLRRTVGGPWRGVAGVSFRRALGGRSPGSSDRRGGLADAEAPACRTSLAGPAVGERREPVAPGRPGPGDGDQRALPDAAVDDDQLLRRTDPRLPGRSRRRRAGSTPGPVARRHRREGPPDGVAARRRSSSSRSLAGMWPRRGRRR